MSDLLCEGEKFFGEFIPYDKIWGTGVSQSARISFDKDVKMYGQSIPAGTYSLYTVPNATEWKIILNKDLVARENYDYDRAKDVIHFLAKPIKSKLVQETMLFDIGLENNHARITFAWDKTRVSWLMETSTNDLMNEQIQRRLLTSQSENADEYFEGATFLKWLEKDLNIAYDLTVKAIDLNPESLSARNLKIELAEKLGKYQEGIEEIDKLMTILQSKGDRISEIEEIKGTKERLLKFQRKQKN